MEIRCKYRFLGRECHTDAARHAVLVGVTTKGLSGRDPVIGGRGGHQWAEKNNSGAAVPATVGPAVDDSFHLYVK